MEDTLNNTNNTTTNNTVVTVNNAVNVPTQNPVTPVVNNSPSMSSPTYTGVQEAPALAEEDLDMRWTRRKCLVCGYTYEGAQTLTKCPKCGNENPDKFDDAD